MWYGTCTGRKSLLIDDENTLTLKRAGLTTLQAKIYLSLLRNGTQTIKNVAKTANVDRSNAYREVQNLQKAALVKKIIGSPNLYNAAPIENAVSILLENKRKDYVKTRKQAERMARKLKNRNGTTPIDQDEDQFVLIPQNHTFLSAVVEQTNSLQYSYERIASLKRFYQAVPQFFKIYKAALEREVKMRVIVDKPQTEKVLPKTLLTLMSYPNYQVRYVVGQPEILGACFDRKCLHVLIKPSANIMDSPCLLTNNLSFILLFENYFETLWSSGQPLKIAM